MSSFLQKLEADLNWREEELALLKKQTIQSAISSARHPTKYQAMLRAIWTMLYAHYEGFCKFAWDLYLEELEKTALKRKEYRDDIAILSLEGKFKELRANLSSQKLWNYGQVEFLNLLEEQIDFQVKLETKSNLHPDILIENSTRIGLQCALMHTHETSLKALVVRRNEIAHGQKMLIKDVDEYNKYEHAAITVMYELALSMVECLDNKLYLKVTSP